MSRFRVTLVGATNPEAIITSDLVSFDDGVLVFEDQNPDDPGFYEEMQTTLVQAYAPGTWKEVKRLP